ncbi:hypothetical protein ACFZC6_03940 [Streptomyces ossamyceticus]|uniref:hypothetical protein n=1 Tax=Streptomyces ossamyceticus TaxID=249581 RepID=UPI0036EC7EC8
MTVWAEAAAVCVPWTAAPTAAATGGDRPAAQLYVATWGTTTGPARSTTARSPPRPTPSGR